VVFLVDDSFISLSASAESDLLLINPFIQSVRLGYFRLGYVRLG
jgi:hypothetical protein